MRRMLIFSVSVFLVLFAPSCRQKGNPTEGNGIVPREQMIRIMTDVEITEAALRFSQTRVSRDSLEVLTTRSFDSLYTFYGITPSQFEQNLKHYQQDLKDFQLMMDEVMLLITKSKDSLQNLTVKPADSLGIK